MASEVSFQKTVSDALTLKSLVFSPNLVWFLAAVFVFFAKPYDEELFREARNGFHLRWMAPRFAVHFGVSLLYYGYFFLGCYVWRLSTRKFKPGSWPTPSNMMHNLFFWTLGMLQVAAYDAIMIRLWATRAVDMVTNQEVAENAYEAVKLAVTIALVPLWRDFHFYAAHRFIHVRALYKYVHSLHHRIPDPEPFSGLTMHPVEHLYYFSNALVPALYVRTHPLVFMFVLVHLYLAPACGHSGFEDHFQQDLYHFLHHAYFECNYGSPSSGFLDKLGGTFRECIGKSKHYQGEWNGEGEQNRSREWSATAHLGLPKTFGHGVYFTLSLAAAWLLCTSASAGSQSKNDAHLVAAVIAYGPIVAALVLAQCSRDRYSWRWPFHKERVAFGLTCVFGYLCCVKPVHDAVFLLVNAK